eukprot:194270-Prorocentrum_minimum.AAC.2
MALSGPPAPAGSDACDDVCQMAAEMAMVIASPADRRQLPQGLHTKVDGKMGLSFQLVQRVLLARALARRTPVLLMHVFLDQQVDPRLHPLPRPLPLPHPCAGAAPVPQAAGGPPSLRFRFGRI